MWQAYVQENGALSPVQRDKLMLEHLHFACAQICATVAKSVGAKLQISDFMPKLRPDPEPEEEKFASIDDVMRILQAARVK